MKTSEFEAAFNDGSDLDANIDWSKASRPNLKVKRVNVDFPEWVLAALDSQARLLGITRQAVIKTWIAERIQSSHL